MIGEAGSGKEDGGQGSGRSGMAVARWWPLIRQERAAGYLIEEYFNHGQDGV